MNKQQAAIAKFRELHESGCFVLPNPWDAGSAIYLEHIGFKALATTSAGFAFSKGLADGPEFVSREMMLEHFREVVAATSLPVNADFQNGYADDPEGVAESVKLCVATGVAGLSIEDNSGQSAEPLYDFDLAVERIKAARAAIDAGGAQASCLLTARCEAYLVDDPNAFRTSLDRLVAFADAGADCLYAPRVTELKEIAEMVRAVAPRPVNVLVSSNTWNVSQLADLGVRRISVGGALARAAWGGFINAAKEIQEQGTFTAFADATPFGELNELFAKRVKANRA
ncbi:MAG TPA: isocitrate lyase/phosphoenolpyruvate mutase family protein [Pyrinomonadaceae bacterium]